jgi:rhomboid family GlyGly-CTERM serine protease
MASKPRLYPEIWGFIAALMAANFTLIFGRVCEPLVFFPAQVSAGEWWRLVTFPFVHVSPYHLMLDAGAFLFLYQGLMAASIRHRLLYVVATTAGSLGASLICSQLTTGLCGLSGIAHGLMAISALEIMRSDDRTLRNAGIICFVIVVLKSMYEAFSGTIAFNFLHVGSVGNAVAICHAGGVLGGLLVFQCLENKWSKRA